MMTALAPKLEEGTGHGHDDHGHDDHGHGHVGLEYQPGLPLANGKLIIWLFLSTEIMFFAGLIGTYIVLRFGASDLATPARSSLERADWRLQHLRADLLQRHDRARPRSRPSQQGSAAKLWMVLTLILGSVFLAVKLYEYNAKFSHGIYPGARTV